MAHPLSKWIWLSYNRIDEHVTKKSPGVYVLTDKSDGKILYVGRADENLNKRIKDYIGTKYRCFKFDYATSPKNAFEKESEIYHEKNPSPWKSLQKPGVFKLNRGSYFKDFKWIFGAKGKTE